MERKSKLTRARLMTGAVVLGALMLLLVLGGAVKARISGSDNRLEDLSTFEVPKGPLTINVSVSGTIKARDQEILKSEVEGQSTILWIIPEGERVKKGDLLVDLDSASLKDNLIDQQIKVQNTEASFISARENLEVIKNQAQSDLDQAQLDHQFAQEDLHKYKDGDYPALLNESKAKITLAESDLKRAEDTLQGSQRLADKEFITQTELEADKHAAEKARLDMELSRNALDLLENFEYKRQIAQLESDVHQAEMALERSQRKASADVVQAEADLAAKQSEYEREQGKLEKLQQQIEKCKIYAPTDGLVVYATTGRSSWRGNREPLQEGQQVSERTELIYLPTTDSFKAEIQVHESSLDKVRPGLPVQITVEALQGEAFRGTVNTIAPLPDAQSVYMNPDLKVYNTEVYIEGDTSKLRTGMSCRADIIVDRLTDVMYVPVQSVVRKGGQPVVYVAKKGSTEPRTIKLGLDNNRMVQVLDGLTPGERVLLAPPLAQETTDREAEESAALEDFAASAPAGSPTAGPGGDSSRGPAAEGGEGAPGERRRRGGPDGPGAGMNGGGEGGGGDRGFQGGGPGGGPGGGGEGADGRGGEGGGRRRQFENMTPEQREQMRQQFENMTPEQREQMREQFRSRREGSGGEAAQ